MSNNRDDKFDSQDDSEYHFSDDEVSYEVESDTPSSAPVTPEQSGNVVSRLTNSRRMLISFAVFLAIVFVVYKMVAPGGTSSTMPAAEIASAPSAAPQPVIPVNTKPAPQVAVAPAVVQPQPVQAAPVAPSMTPPAVAAVPPAQEATPQMVVQTQAQPAVASLPAVIPVQSAVPQAQSAAAAMGSYIEDKSAALNAASQQATAQIQNQYTQQFNEFAAQSKTMENQIQSLSTRVSDMEAQINQLVQVLTRRSHAAPSAGSSMNMANPGMPPVQAVVRQPEVKVAYNVQAIIPGRAWLKSENGETLTVAEGDVIRDVGRVTRIDPYDGVVEINTGTKALSLSYGNGG